MTIGFLLVLSLLAGGEPSLQELEQRCRSDSDGTSCYKAAFMYAFAMGVEKDLAKAATLYERSCQLGAWTGCHDIAVMYERGEGVPKDEPKAKRFYAEQTRLMDKACSAGNKQTCRLLERWRSQGLLP